jgi:hypothetical protein
VEDQAVLLQKEITKIHSERLEGLRDLGKAWELKIEVVLEEQDLEWARV